jgi:type II secretory pathway component PulK
VRNERGSATILVMVLLGVLALYAVSNAMVIRQLRMELQRTEERQKQSLLSW